MATATIDDQGLLVPSSSPPVAEFAPAPPANIEVPAAVPVPLPEQDVARFRLSMTRRYPMRCTGYVVLILAMAAGGIWALLSDEAWLGTLSFIGAGLVSCRYLYWIASMQATQLLLTTHRVILESGVFARHATEFPLKEISDIHIEQTILGRMLDVGDLVIVDDNGTRRQVVVMAVPSPAKVAGQIRDLKG
jgi:hypothetical protein